MRMRECNINFAKEKAYHEKCKHKKKEEGDDDDGENEEKEKKKWKTTQNKACVCERELLHRSPTHNIHVHI